MILEAIIIVLCLQMGIIYTRKYLKTKSNYTILAWGELLFAYSILLVIYIVSDFYVDITGGETMRDFILSTAYLAGIGGVFLFTYNVEKEIHFNKHITSIIVLGIIGFLMLNMFIPMIDATLLAITSWLVFIILIIIYIKKFTTKISDKWRINVYSLIVGTILVIIGFGLTADIAVQNFGGIWVRFFGDSLVIVGILLISALFIGVPSLAEFDWAQKIKYLNVMHQNGVPIAHYHFNVDREEEVNALDEIMIAGGLTSISQITSELIKSDKKLGFVDHGDLKILFDHGKFLTNVLIVDEKLEILRSKLEKFTEQFEFIYEENLSQWDGELEQFKFLNALVKANFEEV